MLSVFPWLIKRWIRRANPMGPATRGDWWSGATTAETTTTGTSTEPTATESTPEEAPAEEDVEEQESNPVVQVESAEVESQSGPAAVAAPARATKPSKAAQPAPLTP